jgi:hypothetical protein
MSSILKRFPGWTQIVPVYAVIAFILYAWTLLWFFWKLPGWLFFLNVGNILSALAYALATNLAESLVVLGGVLILAWILPGRWFRDLFVARGAALCIAGLGYMMFLADQFKNKIDYPKLPLAAWSVPLALIAIALIVYGCGRIGVVRKVLEAIADRATIFVYILVPASLISLIVILVHAVTR